MKIISRLFFVMLLPAALLMVGCAGELPPLRPTPTPIPTPRPTSTPAPPIGSAASVAVEFLPSSLAVGENASIGILITNTSEKTIAFDRMKIDLIPNFLTAFVVTDLNNCELEQGILGRLQAIVCPWHFSLDPGRSAIYVFPVTGKIAGNWEGVLNTRVTANPQFSDSIEAEIELSIIIVP